MKNGLDAVKRYRARLTRYVDIMRENAGDYKLKEFCELRKLDMNSVKEAGIFYINEPTEMLIPEFFDEVRDFGVIAMNNRPIYNERYVIPIRDLSGQVMGMVGYKHGVVEKYMYATPKYFMRGDAVYGLENFKDILDSGYAIIAEGIMDRVRIKSLGFKNSIATCGADKSWERMLLFSGIKKCIFIPDRDRAGMNTDYHWKSDTMLRILLPDTFKDIDEFASQNDRTAEFCQEILEDAAEYLNTDMVEGMKETIDIKKLLQV